MGLALRACYTTAADLGRHLEEHATRGALLLPLASPPGGLRQFDRIALELVLGEERAELPAEVLQVLPGVGVVLRLSALEPAAVLLEAAEREAPTASPGSPVQVTLVDESSFEPEPEAPANERLAEEAADAADAADEGQPAASRGLGPLGWPVEKLQSDWHTLSVADRMRVAKYGKRGARALVLRLPDNTLHNVLLSNPTLSVEEVAVLAATGSIDAGILRRILGCPEWIRHTAVARNVVCHPKATLQQATKAADHLSDNEIRQLTRTGKVRASVKRLLMKKLEQRAVRSRGK